MPYYSNNNFAWWSAFLLSSGLFLWLELWVFSSVFSGFWDTLQVSSPVYRIIVVGLLLLGAAFIGSATAGLFDSWRRGWW